MTNQTMPLDRRPNLAPWQAASRTLRNRVLAGLLAGLLAGVFFGGLVPPQTTWGIHLVSSALLGLLFGLVMGDQVRSAGVGLVWGEIFGLLWWLGGPLTLLPWFRGQGLPWSATAVSALIPQLLGAIAAYGALLGYSYYWLARWLSKVSQSTLADLNLSTPAALPQLPSAHLIVPHWVRALIVGGLGGLLGSWVFVWGLVGTEFYSVVAAIVHSDSIAVGRALHYGIGLLIGCSFGLLFDAEDQSPGSGLIDGINYGLFWWLIGPLILLPWLLGREARPYWTLATIQSAVPSFIGHILYGALVGWFYGIVNQAWRVLFVDSDPLNRSADGAGVRGLRAILMGQAGGVIGGLLFTIVMVGVGALPRVGSLIGMNSPVAGLIVHLLISIMIGTSYGLLFYRKAASYTAEIALGLVYGWFWWVLGAVTLFALLLRQPVDWSLAAVIALYPSLVGHLLYGIGLAIFFQFLARRYDLTPNTRLPLGRPQTKLMDKAQPMRTSAAVWVLILVLGIVLPLLMAVGGQVGGGSY